MHMFYGGGFGYLGMLLPMLMWFLFIVGVIYYLSRWIGGKKVNDSYHQSSGGESALDILKKRYAAGELSTEEYVARKEEIRG